MFDTMSGPTIASGKICYIEIPARAVGEGGTVVRPIDPDAAEIFAHFGDPAGNVLGIYQQPGLAVAAAPNP